jgi:hypothetical protein
VKLAVERLGCDSSFSFVYTVVERVTYCTIGKSVNVTV